MVTQRPTALLVPELLGIQRDDPTCRRISVPDGGFRGKVQYMEDMDIGVGCGDGDRDKMEMEIIPTVDLS